MPPPSIFPSEPAANDTFVLDDRTYIWTGAVWQLYAEPSGVQLVDSVAGKTGAVTLNQDDVADVATTPRYQTWTRPSMPSGDGSWKGLAFGNRVFVAIKGFSSAAATSPDGVTWTARTLPAVSNWSMLAFANGTFFAFRDGSYGNFYATSTDGVTWTLRSISPARTEYKKLVYGNGTFVLNCASSSNHNTLLTSSDGVTWTQRTLPAAVFWQNLAFGAGRFLIEGFSVSTGAASFATSTDGTTWTQATFPLSTYFTDGGLIYADGYFFVFPYLHYYPAAKSRDGVTWTYLSNAGLSSFGNSSPRCIKFGNKTFLGFVFSSPGNEFFTAASQDGQNWVVSASGLGLTYDGMFLLAYGRGRFVAVARNTFVTWFDPLLNAAYGTASDSMCEGNDARLSDARPKLSTASSLDHGNSGTAKTLSATAALQTCSLTGNCTFTLPSAASFYDFTLILKQTGSFAATFTGVRWPGGSAPTISTGADKVDIVRFVSNGSNWYGMITQNT